MLLIELQRGQVKIKPSKTKKCYRKIKRGTNKLSCQDEKEEEMDLEFVQVQKAKIAIVFLMLVSLISFSPNTLK